MALAKRPSGANQIRCWEAGQISDTDYFCHFKSESDVTGNKGKTPKGIFSHKQGEGVSPELTQSWSALLMTPKWVFNPIQGKN